MLKITFETITSCLSDIRSNLLHNETHCFRCIQEKFKYFQYTDVYLITFDYFGVLSIEQVMSVDPLNPSNNGATSKKGLLLTL